MFELSDDGLFVIDRRAHLLWPRCVEGMHWNGHHCTGFALLLSHKQAQQLAAERSQQDGQRWRLPRINELRRLISRDTRPPGLSAELFPQAPRDWHWSGSASVSTRSVNAYDYAHVAGGSQSPGSRLSAQQAWAIDFESLQTRADMNRSSLLVVRLVRPWTADADEPLQEQSAGDDD
ncbi:Lcl C-terminal domain-containing protein [Comamonas composti]|uniref:Lcl C-terminal domain-containing protein n=1 Tax=Comamonas composti TaxID=408558 RepID=UPI000686889C|nr:DUF1566 domain-containing protein [Comamonas composti]